MKTSSTEEKRRLFECRRRKLALDAAVHRASILREPLVQIGLSTGLLKRRYFSAAARGADIARGRATQASILIDTQSLMEEQYQNRLRHYESTDSYKALFYSGCEPSSCITGQGIDSIY